MKPNEFLKTFIEDCRYYDLEKREIKTILKNINLKRKTILDIGTGIGRLSFPLAKYAKDVIAIDKDNRFKIYFKKHKKKNVKFINQRAERFLKQNKKFDIILLAWPLFNFNFINLVKKVMHKDSKFIFITCDNNSDFETNINKPKIFRKGYFIEDRKKKKEYIKLLSRNFKTLIKKKVNTRYVYPNKEVAFRVLKDYMKLWFNTKLNKKAEERLKEIIKKHKKGKKIIFGEKIYFYIMEKKLK